MTRETKAGLLMVVMLSTVFGFMVYKRMHQPTAAMAQQPPEVPSSPADAGPVPRELADARPLDDFAVAQTGATRTAESVPSVTEERDPFDVGTPAERPNQAPAVALEPTTPSTPREIPVAENNFDPFESSNTPAPAKTAAAAPLEIPSVAPAAPANTAAVASTPSQEPDVEFDPFASGTPKAAPTPAKPTLPAVDEFEVPMTGTASPDVAVTEQLPAQSEVRSGTRRAAAADPFETDSPKPEPEPSFPAVEEFPAQVPEASGVSEPDFGDLTSPSAAVPSTSPPSDSSPPAASLGQTIDPFDEAPAKSAVPALKIPSRDSLPTEDAPAAVDDDKFGGFRPSTPRADGSPADEPSSAPGEFGAPEPVPAIEPAPARNTFPAREPVAEPRPASVPQPRRVPRPAPVTGIDEDFRDRAAPRPLLDGDTYQVEPNDNYWTISRKKYGTGRYFMALAQHNSKVIADPRRMRPGIVLSTPPAAVLEQNYADVIPRPAAVDPVQVASSADVPLRAARSTQVTRTAAEFGEQDAGFFVHSDGAPMYRVGPEDTLSGIAQRHLGRSSRWIQIFELNRDVLTDGNTLKIGAVLRLPADASQVEVVRGARGVR